MGGGQTNRRLGTPRQRVLDSMPGSRVPTQWRAFPNTKVARSCVAAYALHEARPDLGAHLRADVGPLPRYRTAAQYADHLRRATIVHVTALSQPWRNRDMHRFGVLRYLANEIINAVNRSAGASMTHAERRCLALVATQMRRRWHSGSELSLLHTPVGSVGGTSAKLSSSAVRWTS